MRMKSILLTIGILLIAGGIVAQDDTGACPVVDEAVLDTLLDTCSDIEPGQACTADGSVFALADAETLTTNADNPTMLLMLNAGLAKNAVSLVLFGDATMTNMVDSEGDPVTLPVTNNAGYDLNMRQGPGTNHVVSGTMDRDFEGVVDGRDATGEWVRVQTEDGLQWVAARLVRIDGDIHTLTVTDSPYNEPMQAFTLETNSVCATTGLWMQLAGWMQLADEETAKMQVNGVDLSFSTATVLLTITPDEKLTIIVLEGELDAQSAGTTVHASIGEQIDVVLGGEDGLTASEAPVLFNSYRFASVATVPASLLPESTVCVAGVNLDDALMSIRTGPSDDYSALFDVDATSHYVVVGQADNWWKLDISGYYETWIPQEAVRTVGRCGSVAVVEAPALFTPADTTSRNMSLVPEGQSVWMAHSGNDVMTGTCTGNPMALCDHPVAINTLGGGAISWRGQEASPYMLTQIEPNTYSYNGRSMLGNGNVSFYLTFTSETTWELALSTVLDDDPACTHTFYYTAEKQW